MSPRKKEEWIEVQEAAAIISLNSGREVSPDYVRLMAHKGRIEKKPKDRRQNYYLKSDVEKIAVKQLDRSSDHTSESTQNEENASSSAQQNAI